MKRTLLKSKIHRAVVTNANLNYEGSISIDKSLCKKADLLEFEKVDVYNITNGERFSTYLIYGAEGEICLNGAAARKVYKGDLVIIASFAEYDEIESSQHCPKIIVVDSKNKAKKNHNEK
ncbi:MAG: aspartate 1-decarboxylase [Bacteroidales bacterium]|nr:aspartate 1-decarboxylase [Bacteroidales bacterium]